MINDTILTQIQEAIPWPDHCKIKLSKDEINNSVDSVSNAIGVLNSNYCMTTILMPVMQDLHLSGFGVDISEEHFAFSTIFNNALDMFTLGIIDLYKSQGVRTLESMSKKETEDLAIDIGKSLKKSENELDVFTTKRRGSWSLEFILQLLYNLEKISDEDREKIKSLYIEFWLVVLTPEFISLAKHRNTLIAHISNEGYFSGKAEGNQIIDSLPEPPNFLVIQNWFLKAIEIQEEIINLTLKTSSKKSIRPNLAHMQESLNDGLRLLVTQYTPTIIDNNRNLLRRMTQKQAFPYVSQKTIEWKAYCGCMFTAYRQEAIWSLYQKKTIKDMDRESLKEDFREVNIKIMESDRLKDLRNMILNLITDQSHLLQHHS